jgi:hypothetical protein
MADRRRNGRSKGSIHDQNPEEFKKLLDMMNGGKAAKGGAHQDKKNDKPPPGNKSTRKKPQQKNSSSSKAKQAHKPIAEELLDDVEKLILQDEKKTGWKPVEQDNKTHATTQAAQYQGPNGYYGKVEGGENGISEKKKQGKPSKDRSIESKPSQANGTVTQAHIVVGIDFGTSCTKVVFQAPYMRRSWAVSFHPELESVSVYLQQTVVYVTSDNHVVLDKRNDSHKCGDLKMLLLTDENRELFKHEDGSSVRLKELSACYIALVLKKAHQWFQETHGHLFVGQNIVWQLNVGMPAKNYDDEDLHKRFLHLAQVGWYLSRLSIPITVSAASEAWKMAHLSKFEPGDIDKDNINVVPEVAAEVAGYARSSLRGEGLHLLVDIGAGTLDISTFLLNDIDGDDRYDFMAADVSSLGCFVLHKSRVEELISSFESLMQAQGAIEDLSSPVPDTIDELLPDIDDIRESLEEGYSEGDQAYEKRCVGAVAKVIKYTEQIRDPDSSVWRSVLPIFLCGGGSQLPFYQNMIDKTRERLRHLIRDWQGFDLVELPVPDRLEANQLGPEHYHRIAVAYGLSLPYDQIGEIVPPSKIDDVEMEVELRATVAAPTSKDLL